MQSFRADPWGTPCQTTGDHLVLVLLTGLRRREGSRLEWSQVDIKAQTLTIPDTKNHEDHVLPLSDFLLELLEARREHFPKATYVFESDRIDSALEEPRYQMAHVTKVSGLTFTVHDLQRAFSTVAESLDLSHCALERLLYHHITGDVPSGYVGKNIERLRDPMQRITDYMLSVSAARPSAQIVFFERHRQELDKESRAKASSPAPKHVAQLLCSRIYYLDLGHRNDFFLPI